MQAATRRFEHLSGLHTWHEVLELRVRSGTAFLICTCQHPSSNASAAAQKRAQQTTSCTAPAWRVTGPLRPRVAACAAAALGATCTTRLL